MSSSSWKKHNFPIHWLVWHNDYQKLDEELKSGGYEIESQDPRGRTPLHLAVTLGHLECTRVLLRHGANANAENSKYWTVVQEAISTGDPEIVQLCLQSRDYQRHSQRTGDVPSLLQKLREAPDFYVEMKWEFTSWVPLMSRICPSDTYKVWKSGANVRIDTTLLGFDNMNWLRGSRSFVFKSERDAAVAMEIDHDAKQVWSEVMRVLPPETDASFLTPADEAVAARLTSPIVTTYIDTDKISFERNKAGIWGWRSDKVETVNGYTCKVFNACNVELVTKTRTEHLTDRDKQQSKKNSKNPLESILSVAEREEKVHGAVSNGDVNMLSYNPCHITPEEYFDATVELDDRDIGRPIEQTTKTQTFKANLWLCEDYPLSLPQQVLPIIDLMAASNAHFRRLKNFITLQLPSGFPVKIEIPLFHVLNARITFGNIFASDTPVESVVCLHGADNDMQCCIDDSCFEPPSTYSVIGESHQPRLRDEDDELLQFAIQQSVMEAGAEKDQVTFWEALDRSKPVSYAVLESEEERLLQRAIEESMRSSSCSGGCSSGCLDSSLVVEQVEPNESHEDKQLRLALELSQKYQEVEEKRKKEEEEELEKILVLSLMEK